MEGMEGENPKTQEELSLKEIKTRAVAEISQRERTLGKEAKIKCGEKMDSPLDGAAAALEEAAILANGNFTSRVLLKIPREQVQLTDRTILKVFNYPSEMHSYGTAVERAPTLYIVDVWLGGKSKSSIDPRARGETRGKTIAQPTTFNFYLGKLNELLSTTERKDRIELEEEIKRLSDLSPRDIGKAFKNAIEKNVKWQRKVDRNIRL